MEGALNRLKNNRLIADLRRPISSRSHMAALATRILTSARPGVQASGAGSSRSLKHPTKEQYDGSPNGWPLDHESNIRPAFPLTDAVKDTMPAPVPCPNQAVFWIRTVTFPGDSVGRYGYSQNDGLIPYSLTPPKPC